MKYFYSVFALVFFAQASSLSAAENSLVFGDTVFVKRSSTTSSGLPFQSYLSFASESAPLLLFVQGSGCTPVFGGSEERGYYSTVFSVIPIASQKVFNVMVVDKPYVPKDPLKNGGLSKGCPSKFIEEYSYEGWLDVLSHAYTDYRNLLKVKNLKGKNIGDLILGLSEGGSLAAGLAARHSTISDVALIGASGTTQLFDMLLRLHSTEDMSKLEHVMDRTARLLGGQLEPDELYRGHSNLRWSSFFAVDTAGELLRSQARVFILHGLADKSVPILSAESLYARLFVAGRDVQFKRVPNAGHSLLSEGESFETLAGYYQEIMDWYWVAKK